MNVKDHFAAICCVYDDERWLRLVVESVYNNIRNIFFLVGNRPWQGGESDNSATLRAISECLDPERKITLVRGDWKTETEQRNWGLALLREQGIPYCFILDADEIYDPLQLNRMQQLALSRQDVGVWTMNWFTYWKSYRYRIDPPEYYKPPVFVRADSARFVEHRGCESQLMGAIPPAVGICHHLSYARSDEEIYRKITTFSHAHEIRADWYENVWRAWDQNPAMENLHPVYPEAYKRAILQPFELLPPVLQRLYLEEGR